MGRLSHDVGWQSKDMLIKKGNTILIQAATTGIIALQKGFKPLSYIREMTCCIYRPRFYGHTTKTYHLGH
jgi:hypothetical protein